MLQYEASIVTERVNQQTRTEALLIKAAIGTVMNDKAGHKHFNDLIKRLDYGY